MRDHEKKGRSNFRFDLDDTCYVLESFVVPHIFETDTQQYFEQTDWTSVKPEEFFGAPSLPKSVKNKIFACKLRDDHVSTLLRELSS